MAGPDQDNLRFTSYLDENLLHVALIIEPAERVIWCADKDNAGATYACRDVNYVPISTRR
jgi:hypothetical protein